MTRKIIACDVMKEELFTVTPEGNPDFEFLPMGLHDYPNKLRTELQESIDKARDYDMVVLGFGYCGQAASGLKATHCKLVIPRVHECIPLFMGSRKAYDEERKNNCGTYFLTGGWTEGDKALINEFKRTCEKFGEKEAAEIFQIMFANYSRLMFINTVHPRNCKAREYSREAAGLLGLDLAEASGEMNYLQKLVNGPWDDEDFVIVEKGDTVIEKEFLFSR